MIDGEQRSYGVVETRPNAESIAERSLERLGYEPLVVRYNKLIRGHRITADGRRPRSRHDEIHARPFIPGYLFLLLAADDDATLVDGANGVKRLFRHRDAEGYLWRPKLIRARIVEQIIAAALEKDETPKPIRTDLKPGDKVRAPSGVVGYLVSLDDKGRAQYMADILGRSVPSRIAADDLELVDA